jgi:hypothetical protein
MRSSGKGSGGGLGSKNVVRPNVRTGTAARAQNPRGVSQIGQNLGNHSTDNGGKKLTKSVEPVRGAAMPGVGAVKLGNQVAAETVCGPGGSRTVMRSGSQAQTGPVAGSPRPGGGDILSQFGPDSKPRT